MEAHLSDLFDMQEFFAKRAAGWEHYVKKEWLPNVYEYYYSLLASQIVKTDSPIRIIDLGCGGGIEFEWIFKQAPNAQVTGVDQSAAMLDCLRQKYEGRLHQIQVVQDSYLTCPLEKEAFDYAMTSMSVHYFRPHVRKQIYERINQTLKSGGTYIEGTYSADDAADEKKRLDHFEAITAGIEADSGRYKLNLPLYTETVSDLLRQAGFDQIEWPQDGDMVVVAQNPR